jgi:transcription elongation factor Elf1
MLEPATPKRDEFGRLNLFSPLQPGWACRWCGNSLGVVLNVTKQEASYLVTCIQCDRSDFKT